MNHNDKKGDIRRHSCIDGDIPQCPPDHAEERKHEPVERFISVGRNGQDRDYLEGAQDIHEADIRFQISVREIYLKQTEMDTNFVEVCCEDAQGKMLPPDRIFENIRLQVDKLF